MYNKILVPMDGSELAECVLPHVESVSKGCSTKEITFVRVAEPVRLPYTSDDGYSLSAIDIEQMEQMNRGAAKNYLDNLASRVKYDGMDLKFEVLEGGRAAEMISDYATDNSMDLIIIATHGRSGISRWIMGSVADRVLRSTCVPVLMVRAPGCGLNFKS